MKVLWDNHSLQRRSCLTTWWHEINEHLDYRHGTVFKFIFWRFHRDSIVMDTGYLCCRSTVIKDKAAILSNSSFCQKIPWKDPNQEHFWSILSILSDFSAKSLTLKPTEDIHLQKQITKSYIQWRYTLNILILIIFGGLFQQHDVRGINSKWIPLPMVIIMKEHITKCKSVAHRCVFNSIWTANKLSGMEYHWVHSQYLLGSIKWWFWYVHGICCCRKCAEYQPSCQAKMLAVNIPANQWYILVQRLCIICSCDYFFILSILRHNYSLWGRHLDTYTNMHLKSTHKNSIQ